MWKGRDLDMKKDIQKISALILCAAVFLAMFTGCGKENKEKDDKAVNDLVKTVSIGKKEMEYICFGKEDGEVLVVLPGLALKSVMGSAEAIVPAYSVLGEEYRIYLFDHIKEEPEGYTIADMAADTLLAFKELGIEKAHIMGVSMGGMVAQSLALASPETASSLILCSTSSNVKALDKEAFDVWKELAEKRDEENLSDAFGKYVYTPSFYEKYKDVIISSGKGASELEYSNFLVSLSAICDFDISDRLKEIKCPVFVIGAGDDRVLGSDSSYCIAKALDCSIYVYEGYGHGAYDEAPDYLGRIKDFLLSIKK